MVVSGGWLGGGRRWHFAIAWFFIANGLIYLTIFTSGEWRRRMLSRGVTLAAQSLNSLTIRACAGRLLIPISTTGFSGLLIPRRLFLDRNGVVRAGYLQARSAAFSNRAVRRLRHRARGHLRRIDAVRALLLAHLTLVAMHPREIVHMEKLPEGRVSKGMSRGIS